MVGLYSLPTSFRITFNLDLGVKREMSCCSTSDELFPGGVRAKDIFESFRFRQPGSPEYFFLMQKFAIHRCFKQNVHASLLSRGKMVRTAIDQHRSAVGGI